MRRQKIFPGSTFSLPSKSFGDDGLFFAPPVPFKCESSSSPPEKTLPRNAMRAKHFACCFFAAGLFSSA